MNPSTIPAPLHGRRILVTQADAFMGPALCQALRAAGAEVVASTDDLVDPATPARIVAAAGHLDVLVANLAVPAPITPAVAADDGEWRAVFAALVDPLPRLCRAVLPAMLARRCCLCRLPVLGGGRLLRRAGVSGVRRLGDALIAPRPAPRVSTRVLKREGPTL